jgi:hypothetical protein
MGEESFPAPCDFHVNTTCDGKSIAHPSKWPVPKPTPVAERTPPKARRTVGIKRVFNPNSPQLTKQKDDSSMLQAMIEEETAVAVMTEQKFHESASSSSKNT